MSSLEHHPTELPLPAQRTATQICGVAVTSALSHC